MFSITINYHLPWWPGFILKPQKQFVLLAPLCWVMRQIVPDDNLIKLTAPLGVFSSRFVPTVTILWKHHLEAIPTWYSIPYVTPWDQFQDATIWVFSHQKCKKVEGVSEYTISLFFYYVFKMTDNSINTYSTICSTINMYCIEPIIQVSRCLMMLKECSHTATSVFQEHVFQ